jgi:hypothetical protein
VVANCERCSLYVVCTRTVFATQASFANSRYGVRQRRHAGLPVVRRVGSRRFEREGAVVTSGTEHVGASRRDRQRQQTLRDLKQATLAEIREHGAVAVSLRSVARRMAMIPVCLHC